MPSLTASFVKLILRLRPYSWAKGSLQEQRSRMDQGAAYAQVLRKATTESFEINGITAEWILPSEPQACVILYFHGGAYGLGSVKAHREFLSRLALTTRCRVLAIEYKLAPENPFPAALQDALFVYHWLLQDGWTTSQVVMGGDSAGGGLAFATIVALKAAEDPLPACAFGLSPWLDLSFSTESILTNAKKDPLISKDILLPYAAAYVGEFAHDHPLVSPLFADLSGVCPLLLHVGGDEIFLDEAVQIADKAQAVGVDVNLRVWDGLFHVFQMVPFLPESRESLQDIARFINRQSKTT